MRPPFRIASLVLVSPAGELLGMLPPVELAVPDWQESADLVAAVAARFRRAGGGAALAACRIAAARRAAAAL